MGVGAGKEVPGGGTTGESAGGEIGKCKRLRAGDWERRAEARGNTS